MRLCRASFPETSGGGSRERSGQRAGIHGVADWAFAADTDLPEYGDPLDVAIEPPGAGIIGMARASIKGKGPGGHEEEALEILRALLDEAAEYYEQGDFPPAMSRMRVANDLVSFHTIRLAGE